MNRVEFEAQVLELWMSSRITLTLAHLQYATRVRRGKLRKWLDEMVVDGTLQVDVDDGGEMVWTVPGAARPASGATSFAELKKSGRRGGGRVGGASSASDDGDAETALELAVAKRAMALATRRGKDALTRPTKDGDKSLLLSAGLSLLGPVGWLYAGSFKEAVPAALLQFLIASIVPSFLLMPILMVALPLSSVAGLVYAWQHNKNGERGTLFLDKKDDD